MNTKEPGSLRLILSLVITGLVSGGVLSGVYQLTLPAIRANQAEAVKLAVFKVLPGTMRYETYVISETGLNLYEGEAGTEPPDRSVYKGFAEDGTVLGYAIPASGAGFMDTIKILYGFNPQKRHVVGLAVLESRETPGLGSKIETDPAFLESFLALEVDPQIKAVPVKKKQNEVDAISGATISSEAVVRIINASLEHLAPYLNGPGG